MTRNKGFTLIEFLLAFAITAVIITALYGTLIGGIRLNRQAQASADMYQDLQWCFEMLSHDLENMVPFMPADTAIKAGELDFHGSSNGFSFLVPDEKGLKSVHYYFEEEHPDIVQGTTIGEHTKKNIAVKESKIALPGKWFLVREEKELTVNNEKSTPAKDRLGAIDPNRFKFIYADWEMDAQQQRKIVWREFWEKGYPPVGVKVQAAFAESGDTIEKNFLLPRNLRLQKT